MGLKSEEQKDVSFQMIHAFEPSKWFLQFFLRFPFRTRKKMDDTWAFTYKKCTTAAITFYCSTAVAVIMFTLVMIGTVIGYHGGDDRPHDRCGHTWESTIMTRQFVPIVFSLTQLGATMVGSLYMLFNAHEFIHYFNYWNKAMQKIYFDPTDGVRKKTIQGHILFFIMFFLCIVIYSTGKLAPLEEASGFIIQAFAFFMKKDLYTAGYDYPQGLFKQKDFNKLSSMCCECQRCFDPNGNHNNCRENCWNAITYPLNEYEIIKILGFCIQVYAMMGARCLIITYEYFCRCLINCCTMWNGRFANAISLEDPEEDTSDPAKRRLDYKLLLIDHATITQLFKLTEETFAVVLCTYYLALVINFTAQFYSLALMNSQLTCAEVCQKEIDFVYEGNRCDNLEEMSFVQGVYSFENPCRHLRGLRQQSGWVNIIFFIVTLFMFVSSVIEAHQAVQEGLQGFNRIRKHGYMSCRSKAERHFIHTLQISYIGPGAIHICAGGYFVIRKKIIIITIGAVMIYFLVMLGFKPGMIKPVIPCKDADGNFIFRYPRLM